MTSREFRERLLSRARRAGVPVAEPVLAQLEEYFRLLAHWNSKINLTSLPVHSPTAETFDRLLVEPLAASKHIPESASAWLDLGSGGGSPAIPLKILHSSVSLTMVEAKARKAAFLREAVRALRLSATSVEQTRFEDLTLGAQFRHRFDLATIRAVRIDAGLFAAVHALLASRGRFLMFQSNESRAIPEGFVLATSTSLLNSPRSHLITLESTFHVEQRGII